MNESLYEIRRKLRRHWFSIFIQMNISMFRYYLNSNTVLAGYDDARNFGDQLTPDVLKLFGLKPIHCSRYISSDLIGVGSILDGLSENYSGTILGAGFLNGTTKRHFPYANISLLRGRLSQEVCGAKNFVRFGDPGILVDRVYKSILIDKPYIELGIVPHYSHANHEYLEKIKTRNPTSVKIIDVRRKPLDVVREISTCKHIISSSLHGLIVADSLGIPNRWIEIYNFKKLNEFKFLDYYSCYGLSVKPLCISSNNKLEEILRQTSSIPVDKVQHIKSNVDSALKDFVEFTVNSKLL